MLPIIYHLSSICVEAQQNAWPGNRIEKCADAYIFRRKFVECRICRSMWIHCLRTTRLIADTFGLPVYFVCKQVHRIFHFAIVYGLGCRNLLRQSQLQTRWTHIFFFRSFHSFLFFARAVPCGKPVGLSPCAKGKKFIYHLCLRRLVLNKTHDREIALWNARMPIYFDANVMKERAHVTRTPKFCYARCET